MNELRVVFLTTKTLKHKAFFKVCVFAPSGWNTTELRCQLIFPQEMNGESNQ
jgi:hypothetical protein